MLAPPATDPRHSSPGPRGKGRGRVVRVFGPSRDDVRVRIRGRSSRAPGGRACCWSGGAACKSQPDCSRIPRSPVAAKSHNGSRQMSSSQILKQTEHRPWPLPSRPWVLKMHWHDLAFMHWPIEASVLRPLIPAPLEIDCFDGTAWLGVVPFRMSGVRPRFTPAVPKLSAFPEINVRTYVKTQGKAGVWFFSLDVTNKLAVFIARKLFHLAYFQARMDMTQEEDWIRYTSSRMANDYPGAIDCRYRPTGKVYRATEDSLDEWLTERYFLYSADKRGRVFRGDIHHTPWPLQPAEVDMRSSSMEQHFGLDSHCPAPLVHFARHLEVVAWGICNIDAN